MKLAIMSDTTLVVSSGTHLLKDPTEIYFFGVRIVEFLLFINIYQVLMINRSKMIISDIIQIGQSLYVITLLLAEGLVHVNELDLIRRYLPSYIRNS